MKTRLLMMTVAALLGSATPIWAADVNSPGIPMLERPSGPGSAPGAFVTGVPAITPAATADPNAERGGRATAIPAAVPDIRDREQSARDRQGRYPAPPISTGR